MVYSWELWKTWVDKQKRENEPHAHTRSHVDNYSFKVKIRMNIGLTYFWKRFSWIGVEIVWMLISQLLLLYMWEAFTHTHILLMCLIHWQCENIFERLMKIYDSILDFEKWRNIFSYCLNVWMYESLVNKSTWW